MGEATKRKALMENAYNYKCCISAELILIVTPSPAFRTVSRHKFQRMNYLGSCIKIAVLPLTTWQWIMCRFHWKHLIRLWIMHEWWRGNHQKKTLLITYTMSHQARNKTICRTECSPPTREGQRHEFSIFAWFTDVIQQFIFIEQSQGIYSYVQAFCLRCPLKRNARVTGLQPQWGTVGLGMSICVGEPAVEAEPARRRSALGAKTEAAGDRTRSPLSEDPEAGRNTWINRTTGTRTGRRR